MVARRLANKSGIQDLSGFTGFPVGPALDYDRGAGNDRKRDFKKLNFKIQNAIVTLGDPTSTR